MSIQGCLQQVMKYQKDEGEYTWEQIQQDRQLIERFFKNQKAHTSWNISSAMKPQIQIQQFFTKLNHSDVKTIKLDWNRMPHIISLISTPIFSALKNLNLGYNNIESLEPLITIKAVNLENIFLWNNRITDIRSLRKANFPNLKLIDLSRNQLIELKKVSQICSKKTGWINLDYNNIVSVNEIVKVERFTFNGNILVCSNKIVMAFGVVPRRGGQTAKNFSFQGNKMLQISLS